MNPVKLIAGLILTMSLMLPNAHAAEPKGLHAFVAFGNNYNFPGSIRVGWDEWEFGQISMGIFGAVKRNFFKPHYYTEFGPIVVGVRDTLGFGFAAGIGFDYALWLGVGFRGEILGTFEHHGNLGSRGNLGLSYDF